MKPQSKVTVFMVVMIVMLSIYYFTLDGNKSKETGGGNNPPGNQEVFSYPVYNQLRQEIDKDRKELIMNLQTQMVSQPGSTESKNQVFSAITEIQKMSSDEFALEAMLRKEGYLDAFVLSTSRNAEVPVIDIRILDSEHSAKEANQIIVMAKTYFGTSYVVNVMFDTPEMEK